MTLLPQNESEALKGLDGIFESASTLDISGVTILPQNARTELLPYLAHMFDVNISGLSESESRALIANSIEIHRYQGTLYSVKKVLLSIFSEAEILEWFDIGGDPYTFNAKVTIGVSLDAVFDAKKFEKCRELINSAKNARSQFLNFYVELPKSKGLIGADTGLNWKTDTSGQTDLKQSSGGALNNYWGAAYVDGSRLAMTRKDNAKTDLSLACASVQRVESQKDLLLQKSTGFEFNAIGGITWRI